MNSSQKVSLAVTVFICFLLVANGSLVLYACLLWPKKSTEDPLFIVGVVTFVICFTLPFIVVTGYLVRNF